MKAFPILVTVVSAFSCALLPAQPISNPVRQMEATGDTAGARAALQRAAEANPSNIAAWTSYAEFLERYGDPSARAAYAKLLAAARRSGDRARQGEIARRLAILDLLEGDGSAVSSDLDAYRISTGTQLHVGTAQAAPAADTTVNFPGPLRSFARMAAIAPDTAPESILGALARNVVTNGFEASHSNDALEQTEYLKLVHRYLSQARELDTLAGADKVIKIANCDAPNVGELIRILGFRMRGGCGSDVVLETVNAARAFLSTDSGFPINELEQALRTNRPFTYDFHPTAVPVLFGAEYWMGGTKEKDQPDFLETFISDPSICRLYLGLSKLDRQTAEALRKSMSYQRLRVFAHVLDFFGGMFEIRNGKAVVPGGQHSAGAWADLVGASPDKGAEFFDKLLAKDDGWLASLYDALARIQGPVRDYLTDPVRMKRFYSAVRGRITTPGPARPVFRSNTDMMLLTTRLRLDPNGKPHIPGNLEVWKTLFVEHPQGKYDAKIARLATSWKEPDDVLEALFALCRKAVENEPLKIFMALSDLDRSRTKPLEPATVERLMRAYHIYGALFPVFSETGSLSDQSILAFVDTADTVGKLREPMFRADAAGSFQALVGLWQILVRQGTIPDARSGATFDAIVKSFAQLRSNRELFDAQRASVKALLDAAPPSVTHATHPQQRMLEVLAGNNAAGDPDVQSRVEQDLGRILDAQRMVSLDTLFDLADHIDALDKGAKLNPALITKLTAGITEIQLPRSSLSSTEKNAMGFGYWTDKHVDAERKLNLRAAIEKAAGNADKLAEVRGMMAPILRDTLVGLNYAYYAPPGAQILLTNPLFVRSHDFLGMQGTSHTWRATELFGSGWPANAGGRLVGSLATLPYALAEAEQNFLVPTQTQALIWGDLVPQMILSAKITRWWGVTPVQVHWVGLHLRYGRELLAVSAFDPGLRQQVLDALAKHAAPVRTALVSRLITEGDIKGAAEQVTPSELYAIALDIASAQRPDSSCILTEIRQLAADSPKEVSYPAISRAFGTPKPTLANSYQPELLNLRTFPALMGYSSRIMAESWESNTLYWASLADETSVTPAELNVRIPEWTEKLVEQIFASHLEDWPALLKSLRQVGDEVRAHNRAASDQKASLEETPNR
jgi:hypothetical protein